VSPTDPIAATKLLSVSGRNIVSIFEDWVRQTPDKPFLIWAPFEGPDRVFSYAEFWDLSGRVAAGLAANGVAKGSQHVYRIESFRNRRN
jgi:carnitine-CoA ligase